MGPTRPARGRFGFKIFDGRRGHPRPGRQRLSTEVGKILGRLYQLQFMAKDV